MKDFFKDSLYGAVTAPKVDPLARTLSVLPNHDLLKLATGKEKLARFGIGEDWLKKYKGSPLMEQAIELEQEELENEAAENTQRSLQQQFWSTRDDICMRKKLLDLELARLEMSSMAELPMEEEEAEVPIADDDLGMEPSSSPIVDPVLKEASARLLAEMEKEAFGGFLKALGKGVSAVGEGAARMVRSPGQNMAARAKNMVPPSGGPTRPAAFMPKGSPTPAVKPYSAPPASTLASVPPAPNAVTRVAPQQTMPSGAFPTGARSAPPTPAAPTKPSPARAPAPSTAPFPGATADPSSPRIMDNASPRERAQAVLEQAPHLQRWYQQDLQRQLARSNPNFSGGGSSKTMVTEGGPRGGTAAATPAARARPIPAMRGSAAQTSAATPGARAGAPKPSTSRPAPAGDATIVDRAGPASGVRDKTTVDNMGSAPTMVSTQGPPTSAPKPAPAPQKPPTMGAGSPGLTHVDNPTRVDSPTRVDNPTIAGDVPAMSRNEALRDAATLSEQAGRTAVSNPQAAQRLSTGAMQQLADVGGVAPEDIAAFAALNPSKAKQLAALAALDKSASADFELQKEAFTSSLIKFISKNPGVPIGSGIGAAYGGYRGSQSGVDPSTGERVGGGIGDIAMGALGGGALGAGAGWGAQGAYRTQKGMKKVMQQYADKGKEIPGGVSGLAMRQLRARGMGAAKDVRDLASGAARTWGKAGTGAIKDAKKPVTEAVI